MDRGAALRIAAIFKGVGDQELALLEPAVRERHYPKGAFIFREGDPGNAMFVVVSGQVKIGRIGHRGDEVVFAVTKPGDSFGELALVEDEPVRAADAQAIEATMCLSLGRDAFLRFLDMHPDVLRRMLQMLIGYLQAMDATVAETASLDIPGRVARKLLELGASHGEKVGSGVRIGVRLNQRTLGAMVAASRENVNRALSRLERQGAITKDAGYITIVQRDRLRRMC